MYGIRQLRDFFEVVLAQLIFGEASLDRRAQVPPPQSLDHRHAVGAVHIGVTDVIDQLPR